MKLGALSSTSRNRMVTRSLCTTAVKTMKKATTEVIRGKPKSGRVWKSEKKKFSSMAQVKPLKSSWATKMKLRTEKKLLMAHVSELKEIKQQETVERKRKRAEKIKRKKENELKSEVVQVIRDSAKIKRMSKKQLRRIEKRDITEIKK